jgi:hypothetical protein
MLEKRPNIPPIQQPVHTKQSMRVADRDVGSSAGSLGRYRRIVFLLLYSFQCNEYEEISSRELGATHLASHHSRFDVAKIIGTTTRMPQAGRSFTAQPGIQPQKIQEALSAGK